MPTYILELPEEGETKALVINLVGTVEKLYASRGGLEVFDAICVHVPAGHPAAEMLRDLAKVVVPDRPSYAELVKETTVTSAVDQPISGAIEVGNIDHINFPSVVLPVADDGVNSAYRKVTKKERTCPNCGRKYLPQGNRQMFCSKTCRVKAGANGSGVKSGTLVSG